MKYEKTLEGGRNMKKNLYKKMLILSSIFVVLLLITPTTFSALTSERIPVTCKIFTGFSSETISRDLTKEEYYELTTILNEKNTPKRAQLSKLAEKLKMFNLFSSDIGIGEWLHNMDRFPVFSKILGHRTRFIPKNDDPFCKNFFCTVTGRGNSTEASDVYTSALFDYMFALYWFLPWEAKILHNLMMSILYRPRFVIPIGAWMAYKGGEISTNGLSGTYYWEGAPDERLGVGLWGFVGVAISADGEGYVDGFSLLSSKVMIL
jgi:hypothetical protein